MGKIVKTLFLILFVCSSLIAATNYSKQLETYDAQMRNANNDEMLRVFHGLKSVYIHSIIVNDESLKKETLERLIKAAHILKIDAAKYESELALLKKAPVSSYKAKEEKSVAPPVKSLEPAQNISIQKPKKVYPDKTTLHQVYSTGNKITLVFDDDIPANSIKSFVLKSSDSYKKVFDIPSIILVAPKVEVPKTLSNLRVSQFNKDFIRVVLDHKSSFDAQASIEGYKVIISLSEATMPHVSTAKEPLVEKSTPKMPIANYDTPKKMSTKHKIIVIDAGHGGKDVGAIGYKQKQEKHLVLDVALQLAKTLRARGHKVYLTRDKDVFINLRDRTKLANDKNADLFLSLHANAAPNEAKQLSMKGLETFFLSPDRSERSKNVAALENQSDMEDMNYYSKETFLNVLNREKIVLSNKAAIDIQKGMLFHVKQKYSVDDGGVREAPFWVLVGATMPSVLIEIGYITNPEESSRMFNPQYQKLLVEGISDGIDKYFTNNP